VRQRQAGQHDRRRQVDGDHAGQLVGRVVLDRTARLGPGVVDQHVDPAERLHRAIDEPLHRRQIGHVDRHRQRTAAGADDLVGQPLEASAAARGQHHAPALAGEAARSRGADAGRGSRDHDGATFKAFHGA
jgi:hypothetical protein